MRARTIPRFVSIIGVICSGFWVLCGSARAEFIQPVAVQVSNGEVSQEALINGEGFDDSTVGSPQSMHSQIAAEMWSGVGSIRESAILDLGKAVSLTKVYIWNFNAPNATDVGMKDVEVQVSSETNMATATAFSAIAKISLKEGGQAAQVFDVVGTNVRLVRLKALSNWGQGYTVGLAEVRFESGEISGNVPSVVVVSPHDGDEIAFGTDILFDVRIADRDGAADLQKVEYFDNGVLVTNRAAAPFNVTLKTPAQGEHVYRVLATDDTGKSAWVTVNVNVRELPPGTLVKIDDNADQGDGLNQIRYGQGTWTWTGVGAASDPRYMRDDHYNLGVNRVDYFEVRFNGIKIDLFATVAGHHGTAFVSIDGGPESKANYKAAQRKEQVFVWGSPILANREHVLKVRTAGDGVVTADRFDIIMSDKPDQAQAAIKEVSFSRVIVEMEDVGTSVVDETTVKVSLDNSPVNVSVAKSAAITTIVYTPPSPFAAGSSHALKVEAKDKTGASLSNDLTFNLPAPFFPLSGLGGPSGGGGFWGIRQIWNAGRVDSVVSSANIAAAANQPGFSGATHDSQSPVINFALSSSPGGGVMFGDDAPLPAETASLSTSDFVIIAHTYVSIPRAGDWTIGVHSDDGFALRFIGAPFDRVSGDGLRDDNFPEYIGFLTETLDSDTRGILQGIPAGTYEIEFVGFQRTAGSGFEIYAAEGAFENDFDTDTWQLIGAPGALELVDGTELTILNLSKSADVVTINFDSPNPDGPHQLLESANLTSWQPVASASFSKTTGNGVRATVSGVTHSARFYRVSL